MDARSQQARGSYEGNKPVKNSPCTDFSRAIEFEGAARREGTLLEDPGDVLTSPQ